MPTVPSSRRPLEILTRLAVQHDPHSTRPPFPFFAGWGMFLDMAESTIQYPKVRNVDHASVGNMDVSMITSTEGFR